MSTRKRNPNIMAELAVAIASGRPVSRWAKEKGIPERTAYMWSSLDEVKRQVKEIRARLTDEAVGRLISLSGGAVVVIGKLASGAESEAVKLQAARAILGELVAISSYAELRREIDDIKARLDTGE